MKKYDALILRTMHTAQQPEAFSRPALVVAMLFLICASTACEMRYQLPADKQERGKVLYDNCAACHGDDGLGKVDYEAPAIAGLDSWYVENQLKGFQKGYRGKHPDDAAGMRMRPLSRTMRSNEDITAVSAYVSELEALKPEKTIQGGDPGRGATYWKTCTACHGGDGAGMKALNAPSLNHSQDWYLLKQLKNFKSGVRGQAQGDTYGAQMSAMISALPDEQAMKDVVAYIQKLK